MKTPKLTDESKKTEKLKLRKQDEEVIIVKQKTSICRIQKKILIMSNVKENYQLSIL